MEVRQVKSMAVEHLRIHRCERCDRKPPCGRIARSDNRPHYLCWIVLSGMRSALTRTAARAHRTQAINQRVVQSSTFRLLIPGVQAKVELQTVHQLAGRVLMHQDSVNYFFS